MCREMCRSRANAVGRPVLWGGQCVSCLCESLVFGCLSSAPLGAGCGRVEELSGALACDSKAESNVRSSVRSGPNSAKVV